MNLRGVCKLRAIRDGQQDDRGREEDEAPGDSVERPHGCHSPESPAAVRALRNKEPRCQPAAERRDRTRGRGRRRRDRRRGCPEALLPGTLTRRLSACRPRLTLPPSRPPHPPTPVLLPLRAPLRVLSGSPHYLDLPTTLSSSSPLSLPLSFSLLVPSLSLMIVFFFS